MVTILDELLNIKKLGLEDAEETSIMFDLLCKTYDRGKNETHCHYMLFNHFNGGLQ